MVHDGNVDRFVKVRGGHGELGNIPALYMTFAEQLLTELEEKKKGATGGAPHDVEPPRAKLT